MLLNYLKVAFRSLIRSRINSAITVGGLAVALCASLLILLFVTDELGYDAHHAKADRLFRLNRIDSAVSAGPMAPALQNGMAGIESATRVQISGDAMIRPSSGERFSNRVLAVDSTYFQMFSHRFLAGTASTALANSQTIVLTESAAIRYFGSSDVLGEPLQVSVGGADLDLVVSAVLEDVPRKSHFRFEVLISFEVVAERSSRMSKWGTKWLHTYVLAAPNTSLASLQAELQPFMEAEAGRELQPFQLRPITEIHLQSGVSHDIDAQGSLDTVLALLAIAALILLIAGANFVNLTIARWARRAKEIGMRRSLGAERSQLAGQFFGESTLTVALAGGVGYAMAVALLPVFNQISGRDLPLSALTAPETLATIAGGLLTVSLLAGLYPAIILSTLRPIRVVKTGSSRFSLQSISIVGQFAVSVFLIIAALTIRQQVAFIQARNLGFEPEARVTVRFDRGVLEQREAGVRASLLAVSGVESVAFTNNVPGQGVSDFLYEPETWDNPEDLLGFDTYFVDEAFSETMGLEVIMGRGLELGRESDRNGFLLNRSAAERLEAELGPDWANPVGRQIDFLLPGAESWAVDRTGPIVGVVEDFHYRSLHEEISPLAMQVRPRSWQTAIIAMSTQNVPATMNQIQEVYTGLQTGRPFEYQFLDQQLGALYRAEQQSGRLISYFTLIAIVLACLGLFAQASHTAELKQREISVRKVFGASRKHLASKFTWQYAIYVMASAVIAIPASIFLLNTWLDRFAYRIEVSIPILAFSVAFTLLLAAATVASQAWRVASANPAAVLRGD